jgi:hypothetical protein
MSAAAPVEFEPQDGGAGSDVQRVSHAAGSFVVVKQANDDTDQFVPGEQEEKVLAWSRFGL